MYKKAEYTKKPRILASPVITGLFSTYTGLKWKSVRKYTKEICIHAITGLFSVCTKQSCGYTKEPCIFVITWLFSVYTGL